MANNLVWDVVTIPDPSPTAKRGALVKRVRASFKEADQIRDSVLFTEDELMEELNEAVSALRVAETQAKAAAKAAAAPVPETAPEAAKKRKAAAEKKAGGKDKSPKVKPKAK